MSKNFIFNMGYDTTHITSVLAKEGVEEDSSIILITAEERDERQKNALDDVRNHLNSLDFDIKMKVTRITKDLGDNLKKIGKLLDGRENVILSLSGGPRDILIPLTLAAAYKPHNITKTYFRSDVDSKLRQIQLPFSKVNLSDTDIEILRKCRKESKTIQELSNCCNSSESTLYRRTKELSENGLLSISEGSKKEIETTSLGEFYLP